MADSGTKKKLGRRGFLLTAAAVTSATALQACAPAPTPTPTPAAPASSKPAEGAPTPTTAAAGSKPAAPAPTTASKPAGQPAGFPKPTDGTPKRGGILKTAFGVTTAHFDLHQGGAGHVLCQMYDPLIRWNPIDGLQTIVGVLAERWETTPDGKTYTFHLREGVKFHDGSPFSSADVVATFNRILNPPEGVVIPNKTLLSAVEKVEAADQKTVKFSLKQPVPYFLEVLASPSMGIYSKKAIDDNNGDLKKVIAPGTGPFKFKDHKVAERWILERNPDYWDKELPYLDGLEMLHVAAWTDRGTAVLTGQADMSWNVSKETWEEGQNRSDIVDVNQFPSLGAYVVYINNAKKPLDDPRVRRAIHLAINRPNLFTAFQTQEPLNLTRYMSHASPYALSPEDVGKLPGYRTDKSADIAEAKKLLSDAGHPNGIQGIELLAASVGPHAEILAPAYQDMLRTNIGVEVTIRTTERALLSEELKKGNFDLCLDTIGWPTLDPITGWVSAFKTGGSQNWVKYSSPELDTLIDQLAVELDEGKRKELYRKAEDILDQDSPWTIIGFTNHLPMWQKQVKGLALDKRRFAEWAWFTTAWLDK